MVRKFLARYWIHSLGFYNHGTLRRKLDLSFNATYLSLQVGVRTPFANAFTALFVTFVLIVATDLLKYVPMAVLGAVMCTSIMSLFEFKEMWKALWVAPVGKSSLPTCLPPYLPTYLP